jgi:tight adherence protein B
MFESAWFPPALLFVATISLTIALALVSELVRDWHRRRQVAKRLKPVVAGTTRRGRDVDALIRSGETPAFLEEATRVIPGLRRIETLLEQSRTDWGLRTFFILMVGLGIALGATTLILTSSWIWTGILTCLGASIPYFYAVLRRRARFKRFEAEFPEAIDYLTRAIRAGHPLSSAIGLSADEGPPEVSVEFRRVFEEQRFGIPFEEAIMGMVDRTDMVDVRIFVIAVLIQREVGGNLAETLQNLATTIRRRFYLRRQLRVYTAQGRMTGLTLISLPPIVGLLVYLLNPSFTSTLFTHPLGKLMLLGALFLQVVGGLWIRKIVDIDM